jgi:hypothetical protein
MNRIILNDNLNNNQNGDENIENFHIIMKMKMIKYTNNKPVPNIITNRFTDYLTNVLNIDDIFGEIAGSIIDIVDKEVKIESPFIVFSFNISIDVNELSENEGMPYEQLKSRIEVWGDKSIWQERLELQEVSFNNKNDRTRKNKNKNNLKSYNDYVLELTKTKVIPIYNNNNNGNSNNAITGGKRRKRTVSISNKHKNLRRSRRTHHSHKK